MRRLLILGIIPLVGSAQSDANSQISKEGITIRGRAVDAATGEPLAGIHLSISSNGLVDGVEAVAGPDGRFVFTGLEDKPHFLTAYLHGESIPYNRRPAFDANGELWSIGDTQGKEILFRVASRPVVIGEVRDEFSDPIPNVMVELFRAGWNNGHTEFSDYGRALTDDRGRYRIAASGGAYIVCADMDRDVPLEVALRGPVDLSARPEARFYRRTCSSEPPAAGFLLAPGQTREVNLIVPSGPGVSLRGQITGVPYGMNPGVRLSRESPLPGIPRFSSTPLRFGGWASVNYSREGPLPEISRFSENTLRFDGVAPGIYRLHADLADGNTGRGLVADQTIEVGTKDITDLTVRLEPAPSIEVSIRGSAGSTIPDNAVQLSLRSLDSGAISGNANKQPDGSYRFQFVDPGSYWLITRTSDGSCFESVRLQGEEVLQRVIRITPGMAAHLDISLSHTCSMIQGVAVEHGQPLPFAHVALLLSGTAASPGDVFTEDADKDGKFTVAGLPPGRYLLWAWTREDPSFPGPPTLASVEDQAATVRVGRGQTANAAVVAIPVPERPR